MLFCKKNDNFAAQKLTNSNLYQFNQHKMRMKKFTLSLIAAFTLVIGASAQNELQSISAFNPKKVSYTMTQLPNDRPATARINRASDASAIIREQPAGQLIDNLVAGYGAYGRNWLYGIMDVSSDGGMAKIVEGEDGNVYIYNLPTYLAAESWVKAERAEGDTIVIHRQLIDQREGSSGVYDYYITKVVWEWTDEEAGEGRGSSDDVVHVIGQRHRLAHLLHRHRCVRSVCQRGHQQRSGCKKKAHSSHGSISCNL